MDILSFNCWVRSQDARGIFQVQISRTETVATLQKAIKNEKLAAFRDVDANTLPLYKPRDPLPRPYKENLNKFVLSEHGEPLEMGDDELSELFPEPPPKHHIHIIVDAPSINVCWLRGGTLNNEFPMSFRLGTGEDVSQLVHRVKDAQPNLRDHNIRLYRISGNENELQGSLDKMGDVELLQGGLLPHFLGVPVLDPLRVVAEVATETIGKRKRSELDDDDDDDAAAPIIEQWRSRRIQTTLPTVAELASLIDRPLSDDEKIPITVTRFKGLVSSPIELRNVCTSHDVQLLFRSAHSSTSLDRFFFTVLDPPPPSGTEYSFASFWDDNVRRVVELLLPNGRSTRNSSQHTATGSLRPDYAFLLNNLCPFRGEEKGPESHDDPKSELADKLAWAYHPAPYVLGYYAVGPRLTLVAISPPPRGQSRPVVHDIASADLSLRKDRIKNICRLINLSGLFQSLADLVPPSDVEFEKSERDNGTIEIAGHGIIKTYTGADKVERVQRLISIYTHLNRRRVPHVDSLRYHWDTTVVLSPRGLAQTPKSEEELLSALVCVLEALEVLHEEPPILHRDIRWPNVMRRLEDPLKWFVIDWEDATMIPATAKPHFKQSTHSPRVFVDGHGTEVDIWGVGELIIRCEALDISLELRDVGRWMQGPRAPSAREALDKIKEYTSSPQSMHATLP